MNDRVSDASEREQCLDEVVTAYLKAQEAGQVTDRQVLLASHPDLASELREFFADQDRLEQLASPLRPLIDSSEPDGSSTPLPTHTAGRVLPVLPSPPRSFGDYTILAAAGQGGMGVVWKARQRRPDRLVALKMFRAGDLASPTDVQRFRNEAEVIAQLDHPHILPVYEVGEHDGIHYFSMKLVEGGNLAAHLDRFRADPRAAARLLVTIARAVHYAHQRGVLHRDLKPSNILLNSDGQPHVSDFGLAKRVETDSSLTQSGTLVGTPSYMAPEQTVGRKGGVTTATDVYGLGAVLYALLTGRPPFQGETVLETLERVREREPQPPRRINPKVDRDLETICLKCLAKESDRRYSSAEAVAEDLECWLTGKSIRARAEGRLNLLWRWCRRNRLIAALTAAVILLAFLAVAGLTTGTWLLWRERGQTQEALVEAQKHYNQAETQRRRAEANFGKVLDGMTMLLEHLDENELPEPVTIEQVRQELAHHMEDFFQHFLEDNKDEPLARLQLGWAYQHLGVFYLRRGDNAHAEQHFRTALAFHEVLAADFPEDPAHVWMYGQSLDRLGNVYHVTGRTEEAHGYFLQAGEQYRRQVQMHPDWRVYHCLAWFLVTCPDARMRDAAEAIRNASRAVELAPQLLSCRGTLGRAQYRNGDFRAAVVTLQNCIKAREGGKSYNCFFLADCFFLAMAYWQLGDGERALHYFERGVQPIGREGPPYLTMEPIRAEAAALLGIAQKSKSTEKEKSPQKD